MPASSAAIKIGVPCSSDPETMSTSCPAMRMYRLNTSEGTPKPATWPMWRGPLAYGQATAERTLLLVAIVSEACGSGEVEVPGAAALEFVEVREARHQHAPVPQPAGIFPARDLGQDRSEERRTVDVDGRRADVVAHRVHALVVAARHRLVPRGVVHRVHQRRRQADLGHGLGDHV